MDIHEIRHRNLMRLIDERLERGHRMKDIAQQFGGMDKSFLSQLKARKKMGDKVARKLEEALDLPAGQLDMPPDYRPGLRVDEPKTAYVVDNQPMSERELALLRNFRASTPAAQDAVDAAAAASAKPKPMNAEK